MATQNDENTSGVRALSESDPRELGQVRGVCLDIDDTLTTDGKLTPDAFEALWKLKRAGLVLVPITGRPAGWCDMIARFWPVDAVVGENGAFAFFMEKGVRRRVNTLPPDGLVVHKARLAQLGDDIRARFPKARWASDQSYREYDLAVDVCEDVAPWTEQEISELLALCLHAGANARLSSIHVNTWFGDYNKRTGFENWLKTAAGPNAPEWKEWLYIGDSPNDEPMFEAFEHTVGVANLTRYLSYLTFKPRWMTRGSCGAGFAEMAEALLKARG